MCVFCECGVPGARWLFYCLFTTRSPSRGRNGRTVEVATKYIYKVYEHGAPLDVALFLLYPSKLEYLHEIANGPMPARGSPAFTPTYVNTYLRSWKFVWNLFKQRVMFWLRILPTFFEVIYLQKVYVIGLYSLAKLEREAAWREKSIVE